MKLILIRHGETAWNREKKVQGLSDIELSEIGVQQAHRLALSLKDEKIDVIYASPLKRAHETARIIGQFHPASIILKSGLIEMDQGDFEGLRFHELRSLHKPFLEKWLSDPGSLRMPNGESLEELQQRAWRVIKSIVKDGRYTAVVSHSFTIASIICKIRNTSLSDFRKSTVDLASKTTVHCDGGKFDIESINNTEHLKDGNL